MADLSLYVGSTNLVRLGKLKDVDTGTYIENATVTATVKTLAGANVSGAVDIAMPKKVGTSGAATIYQGSIDEAVVLVAGTKYKVHVKAISGANQRIFVVNAIGVEG